MKGQAPSYWIDANTLVKGLFIQNSDQRIILDMAACNIVELHATNKVWNTILWLITNNMKINGQPVISGQELGELKMRLPVFFH